VVYGAAMPPVTVLVDVSSSVPEQVEPWYREKVIWPPALLVAPVRVAVSVIG